VDPLHAAAPAQAERGSGPVLQRPDHRAGEEVRDPEVPLAPGEEATSQDAAAQRETGEPARVRFRARFTMQRPVRGWGEGDTRNTDPETN